MKTLLKFAIKAVTVVLSILAARALHADPEAVVWAKHPEAVRKFFPDDKFKMLDAADEAKEFEKTGYLLPHKRDALFHKLNIDTKLTQLDEMDKDMLVMTARFEDQAAVRKHYPMLNDQQAAQLVREVRELAAK